MSLFYYVWYNNDNFFGREIGNLANIRKISITEEELRKLKSAGSGAFATVFADKEKMVAIKRYHEYIKGNCCSDAKNPCLNANLRKYKRLNLRDEKIKYTDTFVELVYEGFKFIGVKKKYYEGTRLDKIGSRTLTEKKTILTKLIRNAKELVFHRIYNLDYKSDNALVTNDGEVKILDLDDIWTKVTLLPNPIYESISRRKLQQTIVNIIYSYQPYLPHVISKNITSCPENNQKLLKLLSYKQLQKFVESVNFEKKIIVIDAKEIYKIDINLLKKYMAENELVLVLAVDINTLFAYEKLKDIFDYLENKDVCVYDVFKYKENYEENYEEARQSYINSHETTDLHVYEDDFKVLKKK